MDIPSDSAIDPAPYERLPQIGVRTLKRFGKGLEFGFEGEFNRFTNPIGTIDPNRQTGMRLHALASVPATTTTHVARVRTVDIQMGARRLQALPVRRTRRCRLRRSTAVR